MSKLILRQVIKAIKMKYPNDKYLVADCETKVITVKGNDDKVRTENAGAGDSEYLPLLAEMYGFQSVKLIEMDLEKTRFIIQGMKDGVKVKEQIF